jgi:hypothetical protein
MMRLNILCVSFFIVSTFCYAEEVQKGNKMQRLSYQEFDALALVHASPLLESLNANKEKYEVVLREEKGILYIFFSYIDKPKGMRGSMEGYPEPIFEIDKDSGKIIKAYFNR